MIETGGAGCVTRRPDKLPYGHDEIFSFSSSGQADLPHFPTPNFEIIQGDARRVCDILPMAHCVVTSIPYFKKRVYGESQNELGQESDVVSYVTSLVSLFSSIRLHQSGSMWINIGDTRGKRGELLNIPAAFAEAMRQAGFLIADHVVWAKTVVFDDGTAIGNFMPEPCRGRINGNGHESFFRFVRTKRVGFAWSDTMAIQIARAGFNPIPYLPGDLMSVATALNGRNIPNVWATRTGQTREKHYAVFPPSLVERPIAMTAPFLVNPDGSLPNRISNGSFR